MEISVNLIMTMKRVDTANHKNKIVVNKNLKLFFKNEYCPYTWLKDWWKRATFRDDSDIFPGGSVKQRIRKDGRTCKVL